MKVKIIDCEHELDLEEEVNFFLKTLESSQIVDLQYRTFFISDEDTFYSYSVMIVYQEK